MYKDSEKEYFGCMGVSLAKFKKRGVNIKRDVAPNTLNKGYEYKINKCKTAYI